MLTFFVILWPLDSALELIPATGIPPSSRYKCSMIFSDYTSSILVFGGTSDFGLFNDLYSFELETKTWVTLIPNSQDLPSNSYSGPRRNSGLFLVDHILYLYGGIGFYGPLNDLWAFNLDTYAWTYVKADIEKANYMNSQMEALSIETRLFFMSSVGANLDCNV